MAQRSAKSGTAGSVVTWLFTNLEGTVDAQTDAVTGVTVQQYRDPFGAPIASGPQAWADGAGYMNKQVAEATALTNVGARTYDPSIGKFLSVDPVIDTNLPQQNTGYAYAGNNPTSYMDPSGLKFAFDRASDTGGSKSAKPSTSNCGASDWSCQVSQITERRPCGWKGKASCTARNPLSYANYSYEVKNPIGKKGEFSAEEAMETFQQNPEKLFPFRVSGCEKLKTGEVCKLHTAETANGGGSPIPVQSVGVVGVTSTATSVEFTVLEWDYFDGPGSTIKFTTRTSSSGQLELIQNGNAINGNVAACVGVEAADANEALWAVQASNLERMLRSGSD